MYLLFVRNIESSISNSRENIADYNCILFLKQVSLRLQYLNGKVTRLSECHNKIIYTIILYAPGWQNAYRKGVEFSPAEIDHMKTITFAMGQANIFRKAVCVFDTQFKDDWKSHYIGIYNAGHDLIGQSDLQM